MMTLQLLHTATAVIHSHQRRDLRLRPDRLDWARLRSNVPLLRPQNDSVLVCEPTFSGDVTSANR